MHADDSRMCTRKAMAYDIINALEERHDLDQETTKLIVNIIKEYVRNDEHEQEYT